MQIYEIANLLLDCNYIKIGTAIRLSRCNKYLWHIVNKHQLFWKYMAKFMGLKRFRTNEVLIRSIRESCTRCRECGSPKGLHTMTTGLKKTLICKVCSSEEGGYCELVCRKQIFAKCINIWSKKRRVLLEGLHYARKTRNNKFLYWGFEWRKRHKTCRVRNLTVRKMLLN